MCCGTPVIATDSTGAAEQLIEHGVNGRVYPVGDTKTLAGLLNVFVDDPGLKGAVGPKAREKALALNAERLADEWVRVAVAAMRHRRKP